MSFIGKIRNGVVVLPPEAKLSDGTAVRVESLEEISLAKRLQDVIGIIENLPSDFSENHDHYIHGTPKK